MSADFGGFKVMLASAIAVFGTLEEEVIDNGDGGKTVKFIDRDRLFVKSDGSNADTTFEDESTVVATLHLNKDNMITDVEHGSGMFTLANKKEVLLFASFVGKTINF